MDEKLNVCEVYVKIQGENISESQWNDMEKEEGTHSD